MARLREDLTDVVKRPGATRSEVQESVRLLMELKEPGESILRLFLEPRADFLHASLENWCLEEGETLPDAVQRLNSRFFPAFVNTVSSFESHFLGAGSEEWVDTDTTVMFKKRIVGWVRDVVGEYFTQMRSLLLSSAITNPSGEVISLMDFQKSLEAFAEEVRYAEKKCEGPYLEEHLSNTTSDVVRRLIKREFSGIDQMTLNFLRELSREDNTSVFISVTKKSKDLGRRFLKAFTELEILVLRNEAFGRGHRKAILHFFASVLAKSIQLMVGELDAFARPKTFEPLVQHTKHSKHHEGDERIEYENISHFHQSQIIIVACLHCPH
jgi:hypothetical protein